MAPSKWITMKHSQAPGGLYRANGMTKSYAQEDFFFKAWIPIVHKSKYAVLLAPQYRFEQLEFEDKGENPIHQMSHWNLRTMGVDIRSYMQVDSASWLMLNFNVNQSGNLNDAVETIPLSYTFSSVFLNKRSANKEIGFGVMANRTVDRLLVLPVFIFNYNFSEKSGLEISIPHKIAWRYNASTSDIFYVKGEASSRAYSIDGMSSELCVWRKTDVDLGVAYNKQLNKLIGFEVFGGYRKNISNTLPEGVSSIKTSGAVFSAEIHLKSPFKK